MLCTADPDLVCRTASRHLLAAWPALHAVQLPQGPQVGVERCWMKAAEYCRPMPAEKAPAAGAGQLCWASNPGQQRRLDLLQHRGASACEVQQQLCILTSQSVLGNAPKSAVMTACSTDRYLLHSHLHGTKSHSKAGGRWPGKGIDGGRPPIVPWLSTDLDLRCWVRRWPAAVPSPKEHPSQWPCQPYWDQQNPQWPPLQPTQ